MTERRFAPPNQAPAPHGPGLGGSLGMAPSGRAWSARTASLGVMALLVGCSSNNKLSVYREPPQVAIVEPARDSIVFSGQTVNFRAEVLIFDETDPTDITHRWVAGSETICEGGTFANDMSGECSWAFEDPGTVSVEVTVTDPNGDRAVAATSIEVVANTPPTIEMTAPSPNALFATGDNIVFEAEVSDAEEDAANLVVTAVSSIDGPVSFTTPNPSSSGEWAGATTALTPGQHLLTFTINDSYGSSDQDSLEIQVFDPAPPTIDAATISPDPPMTLDDLTAAASGHFDLSGETERYRYEWYNDNGSGTLALDASVSTDTYPSGKTTKGDLIRVDITPFNSIGDGPTVASAVVEVVNSPPTAPEVAIEPSSPEPTDPLNCTIVTDSWDDDGDPITYTYEWYQNGTLTGITSNIVTAGTAAHGDTWECVVTPSDGEDDGPSDSDAVVLTDTTAPDAPVIDTPNGYRNEDEWTLTGTCEPGCDLTLYCADSSTSWTDSLTCDSAGEFEWTDTGLVRGDETSCNAECEDGAGNVSGISNTVTTEVCDPYDEYEDSTGYGDAGADAINEWSTISDAGTTTIEITGNVIGTDSQDWYVIATSDDPASDRVAGKNLYNFEVILAEGSSDYVFWVYKDGYTAGELECSGEPVATSGATEYSDYVEDQGEGFHSIPTDTRSCAASGDEDYNECQDMSGDYYIRVERRSSVAESCQQYKLEITNGVW